VPHWENIISHLKRNNAWTWYTPRRVPSRFDYDWPKVKFRHANLHNNVGYTATPKLI